MTDVPQPGKPMLGLGVDRHPGNPLSRSPVAGPPAAAGALPGVPQDWYDAEREAPHTGENRRLPARNRRVSAVPVRRESALIAIGVAAIGGIVAVLAWYFSEVLDAYNGPWTPVGAAIVIGVPVGLFSQAGPACRSLVSVVGYVLVLLVSLMLLTRHDLAATYDWLNDYQIYEYSAIRNRLRDPSRLGIYGLGAVVAAIIPRLPAR